MTNSAEGVLGQILTAVIYMTLLVIQFEDHNDLDLALKSLSITKNDDFSCLTCLKAFQSLRRSH